MAIAFFDLDKTLLPYNSAGRWVRAEVAGGHMSRWQAARAAWWIVRYQLGLADIDRAIRDSIASLRGTPEAAIAERTAAFYRAHVAGRYRPGARQALGAHRAAGDRLVLLTSSSAYLSAAVVAELGLDEVACTRFAVGDDGRFTGAAIEPLCFGAGKVHHARAIAERAGVALTACAYYADSLADLPMLEAVGQPVAVNPDARLRRVARRRGWPVVDWGRPDAAQPKR